MAGSKPVLMIARAGAQHRERAARRGWVACLSLAGPLALAMTGARAGTILVTDGNVAAAPDTCKAGTCNSNEIPFDNRCDAWGL